MLPSFLRVTLAEEASPGLAAATEMSESHDVLTFVSVDPPPVDRQVVPPCFVLLSTSVPDANEFKGLRVSALNAAPVAATVTAPRPRTTAAVTGSASFII